MRKIKYSCCFLCLGLACFLLISCKSKSAAVDGDIPISRVEARFIIDVDNQRELVGSADYVFVGEVLKNEGCDSKEDTGTSSCTNYKVQVLENIKGNLITDKSIPIVKDGGLSEDGSCYVLYKKDELPVEKERYIFYAFAQEDGSLFLSGPNSNIKIDASDHSNYKETEIYQEVLDASNHPAFIDRERFVSIYEQPLPAS